MSRTAKVTLPIALFLVFYNKILMEVFGKSIKGPLDINKS